MILAALLAATLVSPAAAAQPPAPPDLASEDKGAMRFAPPLDRAMDYRVTTRRIGRDAALVSFALDYRLTWQRAGRGYRLDAVLEGIDSDADPSVVRALTGLLQPLVGEKMSYLVAPDGSSIELVDPDGLFARVGGRTQMLGEGAGQGEARQMAAVLASLPPATRDRLVTADIRALVAPADPAIAAEVMRGGGATLRTIAKVEQGAVPTDGSEGGQPLTIETTRIVDSVTGLVLRDERRSWIVEAGTGKQTLVDERVRALTVIH